MSMNRLGFVFAVVAAGLVGCATEDPVKVTLDRAFAARATDGDLLQFEGWIRDTEGTWRGMPFRSRVTYQRPNLLRREFEPAGLGHPEVYVFDGQQIYREESGKRMRVHPEDAQILRDAVFDEAFLFLAELREPTFAREVLAEPEPVDGRAVVQLVVGRMGIERTLSFDAETFDLVSIAGNTWTGVGDSGREALDTRFFDYTVVDGLRVPGRFEVRSNGAVLIEGRYVQWKPCRDFDAETRPAGALP